MGWLDDQLDALAAQPLIGYGVKSTPAAEPTALAALALAARQRWDAASRAAQAILSMQAEPGKIAVRQGEDAPGWPTALAICAWSAVLKMRPPAEGPVNLTAAVEQSVAWLLANRGQAIPRSADFGHNTELVGWAYAEKTHSWVEPTSLAVLALKAAGLANHAAAREGIAVLLDRQLPGGGLNYGNTFVLGQLIRPHVQPTALALLALAGEPDASDRTAKSLAWLTRSTNPETTPLSLGWSILALRRHGAAPVAADQWLAAAAERVQSGDRSPHKLALLALAAQGWPL